MSCSSHLEKVIKRFVLVTEEYVRDELSVASLA